MAKRGARAALTEVEATLAALEADEGLGAPESFKARAEAIDRIEVEVIGRIRYLLTARGQARELAALHRRAVALHARLEEANEALFIRLREEICAGTCRGERLRRELERVFEPAPAVRARFGPTYDALDDFVNGLLGTGEAPQETLAREPEMVYYQPTPARLVPEMIDRADIGLGDIFVDVGSGLGRVPILVALLTGAEALGIERDPAYCAYAQRSAQMLGVTNVRFANLDAREADYSTGTVYYLYTPFQGCMLQEVLARLQQGTAGRAVRVCTYGPCTHDVADAPWLVQADPRPLHDYTLSVFRSP
jgi:hypothetical protein